MGIMSGQLQFSGVGAESVIAARIEGGDVVLLACPTNLEPISLITRPGDKITIRAQGEIQRGDASWIVNSFLSEIRVAICRSRR
jgi:hypothetical protein